jgi:DNA-binding NarL/FixJ family response regulator
VRVVIGEDLALLRDGLIRLLEANGCTIVAAVEDEAGLRRSLLEDDLDVAVVDVRLPPTFTDEGLRVAIEARTARPGLPVLVLSQYVEQLYARELLSGGDGAVGYLLKDRVSDVGRFVESVRQVAGGGTVMDPEVIAALVASRSRRDDPVERLTAREREVLELMAEGRSNAAIAARMVITEKSVGKHTSNTFSKLDLLPDDDDNRRVRAVLAYLQATP